MPEPELELASSIKNVGRLQRDEFYSLVSKSVALVGIGDPKTSVPIHFMSAVTRLNATPGPRHPMKRSVLVCRS